MKILREAISALPVHSISGYEWECAGCHFHFEGNRCVLCDATFDHDAEIDASGHECDHSDLIDRSRVLELLVTVQVDTEGRAK